MQLTASSGYRGSMGRTQEQYKAATYTALAFYALASEDAKLAPGAPSIVAPAAFAAAFGSSPDVAPYGSVDGVHELVDAALWILKSEELDPEARREMEQVLAWADANDEAFIRYQLEPPAIAGRGTANIETDPNLPPREG
jgi:hypothetical protein